MLAGIIESSTIMSAHPLLHVPIHFSQTKIPARKEQHIVQAVNNPCTPKQRIENGVGIVGHRDEENETHIQSSSSSSLMGDDALFVER